MGNESMRLESSTGLDVTVLEAVLECGKPDARLALARQLAAFLADTETPQFELDQVVPVVLKITTDADIAVRRALADELIGIAKLNQDIIFSILADENDIAIPFLLKTPALNAWHMLAVLKVGDDARQSAIARRADLTIEAKAHIIKAGTAAATAALLDNGKVKFSADDLHKIYGRFGQVAEVVERLLARPDLPIDLRISQAKRAAVRMRQMMAERGWLPANDAADIVADAEEGAVLRLLTEANVAERTAAFSFLVAQNMLTPSLIIRASCLGHVPVVAAALGHLTGTAAGRVLEIAQTKGAHGMRTIVNRSGLPITCFAVIAAACEVYVAAKDEGVKLDADHFGRRLLEALMTRFGGLPSKDQARQIEYVGRFADEPVRKIARKLRSDMLRAA
jgi:uncharacterized protein (DUF2336 family)